MPFILMIEFRLLSSFERTVIHVQSCKLILQNTVILYV